MKIAFIGSGNLATHLSMALQMSGADIIQVFSPTASHAKELADKLGCMAVSDIADITTKAEVYILSIKDDALPEVIQTICPRNPEALYIHTAGSIPMNVFEANARRYGVLYPMQTFSKDREVEFKKIPCFIEASDEISLKQIRTLASAVSEHVVDADSHVRRKLHLAAVFACNMVNHCYRLAEKILEEDDIPFSLFLPLIEETAHKVSELSPRDAQTGPMVRNDQKVMQQQMQLINDPLARQIYQLMAESIKEDRQHI